MNTPHQERPDFRRAGQELAAATKAATISIDRFVAAWRQASRNIAQARATGTTGQVAAFAQDFNRGVARSRDARDRARHEPA